MAITSWKAGVRTLTDTRSFDDDALIEIEQALPGLAVTLDLARPGMHTTDTIDVVLVLRGSITLELEGGARVDLEAGESVVHSGTPHAWPAWPSDPFRRRSESSSDGRYQRPPCRLQPWLLLPGPNPCRCPFEDGA
jgi:hypothetical protein